ncbi:MAG: hypothetical protein K6E20_07325 [Acholeplasmatales bacterium]|nr:hypothetical protein [Acholeplasmatales bacterium]
MDYFGLNKIISAILAFFIGSLLGGIVRITEKKYVAGVLRILSFIFVFGFIINIIDLVCILVSGKMFRALEC